MVSKSGWLAGRFEERAAIGIACFELMKRVAAPSPDATTCTWPETKASSAGAAPGDR